MNVNRKKALSSFILVFLIFLCSARIVYVFTNYKEGHHSDETWSYGFANSFYLPYLYSDEIDILETREKTANYNEWLSGNFFNDYLVVNEGEAFRFDSIIYNKKGDMSPPLYEMAIHFISSFRPNTFSWWYALCINLVCFVIIELTLYKLALSLIKSKIGATIITIFYGLSYGAVSTVIYLRMYAMLTMFTILTVYLFQKIYSQEKEKPFRYFLLALVAGLGAFTHYYYLLFAFIFTFVFCLTTLGKRQIKKCFTLGGAMLIGVVGYLLLYPYAISMIFRSKYFYTADVDFPYSWVVNFCIYLLFYETVGIKWTVDRFFIMYLGAFVLLMLLFCLCVMFLFRNEVWYKNLVKKLTDGMHRLIKNRRVWFVRLINKIDPCELSILVAIFGSVLVVAQISHVESMGSATDRYIFNLFPIFFAFVGSVVCKIFNIIHRKKIKTFLCVACFLFSVILLIRQGCQVKYIEYLFNKGDNKTDLEQFLTDKCVIIASDTPFRMEWYCLPLRHSDSVLFVNPHELIDANDALKVLPDRSDIYLLVEMDGFIDESRVNESDGTMTYDVGDVGNWNNRYLEKDFYKELEEINPIFSNRELEFSQHSFCGDLKIYKVSNY